MNAAVRDARKPASRPIGADATALQIVQALDQHLDVHAPSGDAFVVSVYGEWGIGKTRCLQGIEQHYAKRRDDVIAAITPDTTKCQITLPVWFDAWRYEHETHLVVPLMKTVQAAIADLNNPRQAVQTQAAQVADGSNDSFIQDNLALGRAIAGFGKRLANVAFAIGRGTKFKAPGLEFDPKAAIDHETKLTEADRTAAKKDEDFGRLTEAESLYFDSDAKLRSITSDETVQLRLVVLIDDLDRCMPDKAVQVLESIKLFMNVPGFSFVLAVDDEVVERGVAYRYKDYAAGGSGAMPITGAEYLEKIIHLPVHLARFTRTDAEAFLRSNYGELLGLSTQGDGAAAGEDGNPKPQTAPEKSLRTGADRAESRSPVLDLLLHAVPLVPRKLVRACEGLAHKQREVAAAVAQHAEISIQQVWNPIHALRWVALQQLYPELYRFVRLKPERYERLARIRRDAWDEPEYEGKTLSELRDMEKNRGPRAGEVRAPRSTEQQREPEREEVESAREQLNLLEQVQREQVESAREQLNLLEQVQRAGAQRGSPDPLALFEGGHELPKGVGLAAFSALYVHSSVEASVLQRAPQTPRARDDDLPIARLANAPSAVAALLSADPVTRRAFIEENALQGMRLPPDVLSGLIPRVQAIRQLSEADMDWLKDIAAITSPQQLLQLYREMPVFGESKS